MTPEWLEQMSYPLDHRARLYIIGASVFLILPILFGFLLTSSMFDKHCILGAYRTPVLGKTKLKHYMYSTITKALIQRESASPRHQINNITNTVSFFVTNNHTHSFQISSLHILFWHPCLSQSRKLDRFMHLACSGSPQPKLVFLERDDLALFFSDHASMGYSCHLFILQVFFFFFFFFFCRVWQSWGLKPSPALWQLAPVFSSLLIGHNIHDVTKSLGSAIVVAFVTSSDITHKQSFIWDFFSRFSSWLPWGGLIWQRGFSWSINRVALLFGAHRKQNKKPLPQQQNVVVSESCIVIILLLCWGSLCMSSMV